jgi:hypothetical protein
VGCSNESKEISYPASKKIDFVETIHGYGLKTLQVKNQKNGLIDKINLQKNLLEKINLKKQYQKILAIHGKQNR